MKTIFEGDKLVRSVIGAKKVTPDNTYRWSDYIVPHSVNGKSYLFNSFTKISYLLEGEDFETAPAARFSSEQVEADENLKQLVADSALVPENKDETEIYEAFCKIARALTTKKDGYNGFTFLPTTACNARCVYCFEQGMKYVTMSDETLEQAIRFIKKSRNPKRSVRLSWFGGEPLVGKKIIDRVCSSLRNDGIEFKCRMITNGSLVTSEIIEKMHNDWNLDRVQITLDGCEEEYNRRKNYYFDYESAYWHVLSRIKLLNKNGIKVTIRVNIDEGNVDTVPQMIEDLKNFIVNQKNISFDLTPLFNVQESPEGIEVWKKCMDISDLIESNGFRVARHFSVSKTKYNLCMADNPYSSLVISPEGKLFACEHIEAFESLGDVWNGVTNLKLVKRLYDVEPAKEKCRGCFALPNCTTFSGCNVNRVDCRYVAGSNLKRLLDKMLPKFEYLSEPAEEDSEDAPEEC